jgi:hypothetical protein
MNLKKIRCEGVEWINLAQDRAQWRAVANTARKHTGSLKDAVFSR